MAIENHYRTLGLSDFCTDQEKIKDAYRSQIKYFHPDAKNVSQEIAEAKTKDLNVAYDVLSNPQKKQIYDSQLRYEMNGNQRFNNSYSNANPRSNNVYNSSYSTNRNTTKNSNNYTYTNYSSNSNNTYKGNYTSYTNGSRYSRKTSTNIFKSFWVWFILGVFVLEMCSGSGGSSFASNNTTTNNNKQSTSVTNIDSSLKPVSVYNGEVLKYPRDDRVAPLTIKTSGTRGYYVFLDDTSTSGANDMGFYVKGGNTVEIDVPLGSYNFYYCTGDTWYGLAHKFGSNTQYYKADDKFTFYVKGDYVYGHTVTLYAVVNGNLDTDSINQSQFPG